MPKLHLDFETYSELDLKKVGTYKYVMHPSTEILMASFAHEDFPVQLWDATENPEPPLTLLKWLHDPEVEIHAFNANFERLILSHKMNLWLAIERFHCSMVHAWSLSFSGGLGAIGKQMGIPKQYLKDARGDKLIQKFCKPAPKNHKADRYTRHNAPQDWADFCQYCIQDTESERYIGRLLDNYPIPQGERDLWFIDQRINDRGLPIDIEVAEGAVQIYKKEVHDLKHEMNQITHLSNANSIQQLGGWLEARGVEMDSLDKDTVKEVLKEALPNEVRHVLELRQQVSKTSSAKWKKLLQATCDDKRLRGTFAFGGAQRTQRWAGRIFQPHNLARPKQKDIDKTTEVLAYGNNDLIRALYTDNVMQFLADNIRSAVTAPNGYKILVSDLASIESRVLGYITGCHRINNIFAQGKDTYKDFAQEVFHIPYEEVNEEQRHFSKPPVLGSGYGLGAEGLKAYAEGYGVDMDTEEAQRITDLYRATYPEVPAAWRWLSNACMDVIEHRVEYAEGCGVRIYRDVNFMFINLPSGRRLAYYQPRVDMKVPPWELKKQKEAAEQGLEYEPQKVPNVTYMGMDQYTKKWVRQSTHGGKIVENLCQAIARDILGFHMILIEKHYKLMEIILHVHDELGALIKAEWAEQGLKDLITIMSTSPPWAPYLLLGAKGFITQRYKKD